MPEVLPNKGSLWVWLCWLDLAMHSQETNHTLGTRCYENVLNLAVYMFGTVSLLPKVFYRVDLERFVARLRMTWRQKQIIHKVGNLGGSQVDVHGGSGTTLILKEARWITQMVLAIKAGCTCKEEVNAYGGCTCKPVSYMAIPPKARNMVMLLYQYLSLYCMEEQKLLPYLGPNSDLQTSVFK